jgi:hypothetical protein
MKMIVKMFAKSGGYFTSLQSTVTALEREINDWLKGNPGIRMVAIKQSASGGSLEPSKVVVSVWYEPPP